MSRDPLAEPAAVQAKGKGGGKKAKHVKQERADTSRGNPVTVVLDDSDVQLLALQDRHSKQLRWSFQQFSPVIFMTICAVVGELLYNVTCLFECRHESRQLLDAVEVASISVPLSALTTQLLRPSRLRVCSCNAEDFRSAFAAPLAVFNSGRRTQKEKFETLM